MKFKRLGLVPKTQQAIGALEYQELVRKHHEAVLASVTTMLNELEAAQSAFIFHVIEAFAQESWKNEKED